MVAYYLISSDNYEIAKRRLQLITAIPSELIWACYDSIFSGDPDCPIRLVIPLLPASPWVTPMVF